MVGGATDATAAEKRRAWLGAGCVLLLLGYLAWPMFVGEIHLGSDLRMFYLPLRHFYADCLARGLSFLWFPYQFNGFYLHGEGQLGLYHPFNLASYAWLPFHVAFNLELLRAFVFMAVGCYWLARRWELPRDAALLAAALCAFSGFQLVHFMHLNALNIVAHLPFALLAIHSTLRSPRPGRVAFAVAALALLSASQLQLGHPQFVWLCLVVEAVYAGCLAYGRRAAPQLALLLAAQLVAVALAGIAVVPQWESLQLSQRAAPAAEFPDSFALPITQLAELVSPWLFAHDGESDTFAEFSVYDGAVPLVLCAWLFVRRRDLGARRSVVWVLAAVALVSLVLSLGKAGLLYSIQTLLPVVGLFRAPARYLLLVHLALGFLSAIAFADLCRRRDQPLPWRALAPLGAPLAAAVLVALGATLWQSADPDAASARQLSRPALFWIGPALLALAGALVAAAARGRRVALAALIVLAVADLGIYGTRALGREPSGNVDSAAKRRGIPRWADAYRVQWLPPETTLHRVRMVGGYVAMEPNQRLRTRPYDLEGGRLDRALLQAFRVSNVRSAYGVAIPSPLPRARLVSRAVREQDLERQLAQLDVDRVAIVDADLALPGGPPGRAAILEERPGSLRIETYARTQQLLVLAESFHPGWTARVDETRCELLRVYGDFMGCVVPEGSHFVQLEFEPASLRLGARVSAFGMLALAALVLVAQRVSARPV